MGAGGRGQGQRPVDCPDCGEHAEEALGGGGSGKADCVSVY